MKNKNGYYFDQNKNKPYMCGMEQYLIRGINSSGQNKLCATKSNKSIKPYMTSTE